MLGPVGRILVPAEMDGPGLPPPPMARAVSWMALMDDRVTSRPRGLRHWLGLTSGAWAGQGRSVSAPNPIVTVGGVRFGNALPLALIAGPCQLESRQHALEMAS